jgi:hypothetical protein
MAFGFSLGPLARDAFFLVGRTFAFAPTFGFVRVKVALTTPPSAPRSLRTNSGRRRI